MAIFRNKRYFLWLSILIAFGIALMQVLNSSIGILICLIGFGGLAVLAALKDMAIPVLLFFLPWSPLLKLQPGTMSVYTIALIAVMLVFMIRNSKRFSFSHVIPAMLLFVQTIIIKTVAGDPLTNGCVLFFLCLVLFPSLASEKEKDYDYYTLVLFFALGITTAAISAKQLAVFPTISRYITVLEYGNSITRLSGYYGDPNFYSAHISAAIAGVLVLLLNESKLSRKIIMYIMLAVLLYCGFLSVSKSFAVIIICVALLWIIEVLFRRGKISSKLMMLLALAIGGLFIISSALFTDLIDMMLERFIGAGNSLSDLTTHRSELWMSYLRAFEDDPLMLFFGKGFTDKLIGGRGTHNVVLQAVYQFGLVGACLLLTWFLAYCRSTLRNIRLSSDKLVQIMVVLVGSLGPWLGIDTIMFDEFFIIPFFVFVAILQIAKYDSPDNDIEVTE